MILIITNAYKDENNQYENGFIHSRVIEYIKRGLHTEVFVLNSKKQKRNYVYEDVCVTVGDCDDLLRKIEESPQATLCVHFISDLICKTFNRVPAKRNVVLFVHGVEALKWNERIFPGMFSSIKSVVSFGKYIVSNIHMLPVIRKFLHSTNHNIVLITVSEWMKDIAEKNWKCKGKFQWNIIPNIIDAETFKYEEKEAVMAKKLLSIRPFTTGKYANDITIDCVRKLSDTRLFEEIIVKIVGKGPHYHRLTDIISNIPNVILDNRFLNQKEIIEHHKEYGIFLCPTRQDAQGVSMCEAMSSGLVPITLYNTAIPEFLPNDKRLICHNSTEMMNLIVHLIEHPDEYKELSKKCSSFISEKCGYEATVKKEIALFLKLEG